MDHAVKMGIDAARHLVLGEREELAPEDEQAAGAALKA